MTRKSNKIARRGFAGAVGDGPRLSQPTFPEIRRRPDFEEKTRGVLEPGTKCYSMGKLAVFVSPPNLPTRGWHLSISHPTRYPTWDEIAHVRYTLVPDSVRIVMHLPPRSEYVALHPFCFNLWEIA